LAQKRFGKLCGRFLPAAVPKTNALGLELADLPGFLDHLRSIRLALLAVGMKRGPGKAEQGNHQNERFQQA